jgi:hypothetical protein
MDKKDKDTPHWAKLEKSECPCCGSGWSVSPSGHLVKCPIHYEDQEPPEVY